MSSRELCGQRPMSASGLDHKSIVAMSQICTEDLDAKIREKSALSKQLADLKRGKLQQLGPETK